jgi:hypothetical protein
VVGDERAESEAPPIHHCLGLLAPVCLKVEMVCEVVVNVQPPGFAQGVKWAGELETVLEVVVDIQPPGFAQGVKWVGESETQREVVVDVDIQPPGFAQEVKWAGESETVLKVVVDVQPPGFAQGVEWAGESETVLKVVVSVQCSGLVLSAEGGLRWQRPHRLSPSLLVELASAACAYKGPTPVLACGLKISSFTLCGRCTRSTMQECQQPICPQGCLQTAS